MNVLEHVLDACRDALSVAPGRSVIAAGYGVAWDDCCDGQLSVRVIRTTPLYKGNPINGCPVGFEHLLSVSLVRCVATMNDRGQAPTEDEMTADGRAMIRDMNELANILQCMSIPKTLGSWLGPFRTVGPQGGCAGGEWDFTVRVPVPMS